MTIPRRILLTTPLRSTGSARYIADIAAAIGTRIPDVEFTLRLLTGPAIGFARNELAHALRASKFNEIVFVDADLPFTVDQLVRLCSHQVPIVCGLYAARSLDTIWTTKGIRGEEPDANGLMKVAEAALGFSKITNEAFQQIAAAHPDRRGLMAAAGERPILMHDFFPMGLTGANTADTRVANMLALFKKTADAGRLPAAMSSRELIEFIENVERLLTTQYPEMNVFRGEDYSFCRMARESGLDVLLDTRLVLPHEEPIALPIPTEQLEKMLAEPWRQPERTNQQP